MQDRDAKVYAVLTRLEISYEKYDHPPAMTMDDLQELDARIGVEHCKNLFLCNKQGYFLALVGGGKKFRTAQVSPQVPTPRLSFGTDDKLMEYLGLEGGAISPLGLINDTKLNVRLLIDCDLKKGRVALHPNVNTATVVISLEDFYEKFLPYTGHVPQFITIDATES